ncbi:MAG: hypothetical protein CMN72_00555 [Sphingomonas sp.]|nr:hypothetical protein [Sphingomonas sp.]
MSRGPDAATLVERALARSAAETQCDPVVTAAEWESWASVTFTGARHRIELSLSDGEATRVWLAGLAEREFALPGHLVADLEVAKVSARANRRIATIHVLTVEDR